MVTVLPPPFPTLQDGGFATSAGANTLTDSTKSWTAHLYKNCWCLILQGTGAQQWLQISDNTSTALTMVSNWNVQPDSTSQYDIFLLQPVLGTSGLSPGGVANALAASAAIQGPPMPTFTDGTGLRQRPSLTVSANGPDEYGDYGGNTPSTTTCGIQEVINSLPATGGAEIIIRAGVFCSAVVTVNKPNIKFTGPAFRYGNAPVGFNFGLNPFGVDVLGFLLDSTSQQIYNIEFENLCLGGIEANCVTNPASAIKAKDCTFFVGLDNGYTGTGIKIDDGGSSAYYWFIEDSDYTLFTASSSMVTMANTNANTGQFHFIRPTVDFTAANQVFATISGQCIPTFEIADAPAFYIPAAATNTSIVSITSTSNVEGLNVHDNWIEPHTTSGTNTLLSIASGLKVIMAQFRNNRIGSSSAHTNLLNNANPYATWTSSNPQSSTIDFIDNLTTSGNVYPGTLGALGPNIYVRIKPSQIMNYNFYNGQTACFDNTNNTVLPGGGQSATPTSAQAYTIEGGDCILNIANGTVSAIALRAPNNNNTVTYASSNQVLYCPLGWSVKITWTSAPSVTAYYY